MNISKTKKDIPKRKTPFFFTLKSLSNKRQFCFYFIGTLRLLRTNSSEIIFEENIKNSQHASKIEIVQLLL